LLRQLKLDLRSLATESRAENSAWYFKTGKGEYGEGDIFLGVTVPDTRAVAKKYKELSQQDLETLANSKYHEERLTALHILNHKYSVAQSNSERVELFEFWLSLVRTNKVNNWDLIDTSAPVLGEILSRHLGYGAPFMHALAASENLWERRAAIILTFPLIRINKFGPTLAIARDLLNDKHDLIHKAVGWMLREVGNRNEETLTEFLIKYKNKMPRTTLRYAIEKYPEKQRRAFLAKD
jgi:3-methyladenine DNA glycosylase AlkD